MRFDYSIGVGGWVVNDAGAVLLVRMTYGPAKDRLMLPGGHLDPGEALDVGALREVREETGVECAAGPLVLVRQRAGEPYGNNVYLVFHLTPLDERAPVADGQEVSEAVWLTPAAIVARDDVQPIVRAMAQAWLDREAPGLARRDVSRVEPDTYHLWAG